MCPNLNTNPSKQQRISYESKLPTCTYDNTIQSFIKDEAYWDQILNWEGWKHEYFKSWTKICFYQGSIYFYYVLLVLKYETINIK